jgi:hypothetical protein
VSNKNLAGFASRLQSVVLGERDQLFDNPSKLLCAAKSGACVAMPNELSRKIREQCTALVAW